MSYSLDFTTHADVINTELRFQQSSTTAEAGLTTSTAWDNAYTYAKNEVVKYNGKYWVSTQSLNLNNTPTAGSLFWDAFVNSGGATNTGMIWRGVWSGATTYSVGDVVSESFSATGGRGIVYISILDSNTNNPPSISPTFWAPLAPDTVSIQSVSNSGGAWVSGNRYLPDQIVLYTTPNETGNAATYFICIADTVGNTTVPPALATTSRLYWLPLDSATFLGTWTAGSRYDRDNVVALNGVFYQSLTDNNVGQNPFTLSSTNWSPFGYKGCRIAFNSNSLLNNVNLGAGAIVNLKQISAATIGNQVYNYARGFGYLLITAATYAATTTFSLYLSETSAGAIPVNNAANIQYISGVTPSAAVTGVFFDLSRLTYYNPTGFSQLFLVISSSAGGTGVTIIPVGATHGVSQGISQPQPTTTVGTTAFSGVTGLELIRAPFTAI